MPYKKSEEKNARKRKKMDFFLCESCFFYIKGIE